MIGAVRIAIVGYGLIGGSIARALRRTVAPGPAAGDGARATITAWSRRPDGPRAMLAAGLLDAAPDSLAQALEGADLIVLAAPPLACLDLLDQIAGPLRPLLDPAATVTDVASTKQVIVERADRLRLRFVGGHPMAGREVTGYAAALDDLFIDRPWVVCPGVLAGQIDLDRVEGLATACGARPMRLDPATHDAAVAAISHVPLVLSAALAEAVIHGPAWLHASTLAASGWRDMTRLAHGDVVMGAGIAATNATEIARGIRAVRAMLDAWLAALEAPGPDPAKLEARFRAARDGLSRG
jgi:prephenate dehydrogenase